MCNYRTNPHISSTLLLISLDKQQGLLYYFTMKNKALQIADNNLKGHLSHAIARMSTGKAIVSQSPKKGKVYDGLLQLQFAL